MSQRQARYMEAIESLKAAREDEFVSSDWRAFFWVVTTTRGLWELVEPCIVWNKSLVNCEDQLYRMAYEEQLTVRTAQSMLEGWAFQVSLAAIAELPEPYFGAVIESLHILHDKEDCT